MSWFGPFRDGCAHGAGGSAVPSGTDAAPVGFLICTDISLGGASPGYAAAHASAWAARGASRLPLACGAAA
jgi:hypothetical protein